MANDGIVFEYDSDTMRDIFDQDQDLTRILVNNGLYIYNVSNASNPIRLNLYKKLASLLLANSDFIDSSTIEQLWTLKFIYTEINSIFSYQQGLPFEIYQQIFFSYKYGTVKHFFQNNWRMFIPSFDTTQLGSSDKMNIFAFSFFREFDRMCDIINKAYNVVDIDKTPNEYLTYLIQLLGYEKADEVILNNAAFRQLAKNILEVYKIKGTNYSYELFFNFLGFQARLVEYWFDKRMKGMMANPFTGSNDPTKFAFFLTPHKPDNYVFGKDCLQQYKIPVMANEITGIRNVFLFDQLVREGYTIESIIGENPLSGLTDNDTFTYFKTNVVEFKLERMRGKESDPDAVSSDMDKIIKNYIDFLTPIFIYKIIAVTVNPFEDYGSSVMDFSDNDIRNLDTNRVKSMFRYIPMYHFVEPMYPYFDGYWNNPIIDLKIGTRQNRLDEKSDKLMQIIDDAYLKYIYTYKEYETMLMDYLDHASMGYLISNYDNGRFGDFIDLESTHDFKIMSVQSLDGWQNSIGEWDSWTQFKTAEKFGNDIGDVPKLIDMGPNDIFASLDDISYISESYQLFYDAYLFYDSLNMRIVKMY